MGTREVERFKARSADGKHETTIVVRQTMIDAGTQDDPHAVIPGLKEARTIDGRHCNYKGEGQFEVVGYGIILTRV